MISTSTKLYRVLIFTLVLVALGSLVWLQVGVEPAAAEDPPVEELILSVVVSPEDGTASISGIGATPVFEVGETFQVSIVATGVVTPGLFGGQFELTYDTNHLAVLEDSLASGMAMEPVVVARSNVDNTAGLLQYAASRQGDIENLMGDVVLATMQFEAVGPTEPPEGQTTVIHLQDVKLGAKGGIEVPVSGLVDLEVIIVDGTIPGRGDMTGNVKVEGRADDNQAGHLVTAAISATTTLTGTTEANGDFWIDNAPAGTYVVTADEAGFLAASCADVVHAGDSLTTLNNAVLLAGDINDDQVIDITDAVAIGAVFGNTTGEVADLNLDGVVDVLDLILMAVNYGQTSADNPWVCQASEL
jgi:hypothetical protein